MEKINCHLINATTISVVAEGHGCLLHGEMRGDTFYIYPEELASHGISEDMLISYVNRNPGCSDVLIKKY